MRNLIKKLKNKKGFTLMEMLIVVAIMVILVAVAIPVFTSQLDQAKKATDDANERAAKSVLLTAYMTGTKIDSVEVKADGTTEFYYTADGTVTKNKPSVGYGKLHDGYVIEMILETTGTVKIEWVEPATAPGGEES